jgi:Carboxypeptidase regulatory-like domain
MPIIGATTRRAIGNSSAPRFIPSEPGPHSLRASPVPQRTSHACRRAPPVLRWDQQGAPVGRCAWVGWIVLAAVPAAGTAQVRLSGRVVDETRVAVPRALISLQPQSSSAGPATQAVSDQAGSFHLDAPTAGRYLLRAEREGFFLLENDPVDLDAGANEITIVLHHQREVHESIEVSYSPAAIDLEQAASEESVTNNDILFVPYPSSHSLQNAMRVMPGAVVQDAQGEPHFNGGAAEQTYWTLDGFNVTDPLTGRFDTGLSVEAARSLTLSSGRYSAEFGKGSAGTFAIQTGMGDDQFRYTATNFVPGLENRKGLIIGDWRPRLNLSGPLLKGRAWFFNSLSAEYSKHVVDELPKGEDRTTRYGFSNLLRGQVNLTSSNILSTGILLTAFQAPRNGLSVLDPPATTVDQRARQAFFDLKDQHYFSSGLVIELGYARNSTFGRDIPQGSGLYILTPQGRLGNYFADARRWSTRNQWLANVISPAFSLWGAHTLKAGVDLNSIDYHQDTHRTGYEHRSLTGQPLNLVQFAGSGAFRRTNTEFAWFLQDAWKPHPRLLLELGVRQDWDRIVGDWAVSPRISANWSPPGWDDTKISAGYGIVYDATNLRTFTRYLDQRTLTTIFNSDGLPQEGPLVTLFEQEPRGLRAPRYENWSVGLEQRLPAGFFARLNYLRKRGRDGFTFANRLSGDPAALAKQAAGLGGAGFGGIFQPINSRRDVYDSVEVTVRKNFLKQYTWLGSYTRSRARSNSVLDISIDNPVLFSDNFGPMPWDAPNRFLSWSYFPLSQRWAFAYMLEWRSGYPFSVEDERGSILGGVNSHRFPDFFELNVQLERRLDLFGYRWALRAGVNNLTNRLNPTLVNNVTASPDFLGFYGGSSRAFITRIRWLGKKERCRASGEAAPAATAKAK